MKLLEKIGRRVVLSQAGERVLPYVGEVLLSVDRLQNFETDLKACQGDLLITYPTGRFPLALVASGQVKRSQPDFVTPGQSIPVPFLINEEKCIFRQSFERYLGEKSIALDRTIELWSIPTIKNLVKSGLGVTYLPRSAVRRS